MKLLSLVLSLLMTFNVLAASGTAQELERAFDDYQYAVTVEWDQKDQTVYEAETQAFFERMGVLMSEEGVGKEQILALAEKKMGNKQSLEALKLKLSLIGEVKSSEELARVLRDHSKEFYGQGASWSPSAVEILGGVAAVLLIGYLIWFNANHVCVAYNQVWECDSYSNSSGSHTSTSCGWYNRCSRYAKK